MPILTLEAIRANPWNAVFHQLPLFPDNTTLWTARLAAEYCCTSEHIFLQLAMEGRYWPGNTVLHKQIEARWRHADDRLAKILRLCEREGCRPFPDDFSSSIDPEDF